MTSCESNLIILCNIDRQHFTAWKEATHDTLQGLEKWIELPSFRRVLMIFDNTVEARNAFEFLHSEFPGLHLFFGPNMPLDVRPSYLALPDAGKLWFTSPPASPPGEWEEGLEEPPNTNVHHDDDFNSQLNLALRKYQAELHGDDDIEPGPDVCVLHAGDDKIPKLQVQFDGPKQAPISLPKTSMP